MSASRAQLLLAAEAAHELKERRKRRAIIGSLESFVRAFWSIVEPHRPLVWSWHMTLICEELERSYRGELPGALVVNIPPRHSKSSLLGVLGPAWWWLHSPQTQFLAVTKLDKNAKRDARHHRRVCSSALYRALVARQAADGAYQSWDWSKDQNEIRYFANSAGGHRISVTVETDVIGVGADLLIIDDPHDAEEVNSTAERAARAMDEIWERYREVWSTRLNPGGRAQCIMQRLHESDLAGRLLADPETTALVLPLEFEEDHPRRHLQDPRTVEGELLAPGRFSERDILRLKTTPQMYAGQAQQRPSPKGGGQIKREWFKVFYKCSPHDLAAQADEVWITADAAKKANADADFHAIQAWCRIGGRRILLDRRHERMNYPQFELAMDGMVALWKPSVVLVEDTANGTTYIQCKEGISVCPIIGFHPGQIPGSDKSKGARAIYLERSAEAGQIELPDPSIAPWIEEWIHEITCFPAVLHDDDVDAASQLMVRWTLEAAKPQLVTPYGMGSLNRRLAGRLDFRD